MRRERHTETFRLRLRLQTDVCVLSEPDSSELQEAVSKDTFQHDFTNLEASTTFSIYVKAYSPLGASQQSDSVIATTHGAGKSSHAYRTDNTQEICVCVCVHLLKADQSSLITFAVH